MKNIKKTKQIFGVKLCDPEGCDSSDPKEKCMEIYGYSKNLSTCNTTTSIILSIRDRCP